LGADQIEILFVILLVFYIFFIDMHVGNVGNDEREGAASAPAPNTAT
jgi:hypothetical protein